MSAAAQETATGEAGLFAAEAPTLWPSMVLPRLRGAAPFPFGDPRTRYFYFASA